MYCKECGYQVTDDSKFCASCGKSQNIEAVFNSENDASAIVDSSIRSFTLTLEETYYNRGFFNVTVDNEMYFGSHDESIEIICENNPNPIIGKINRTDNNNKTPRIKGGKELKHWLNENCQLKEEIEVEIINKNKIHLKVIKNSTKIEVVKPIEVPRNSIANTTKKAAEAETTISVEQIQQNFIVKITMNDLLKKINFDDYYIEATFQFKLLMQLGKIYDENKIFPERSIKAYGLKAEDYTKKEIDIVIEQENNSNIAIELKMPMNGQVPEQMFKFIEDIKFLEELNDSEFFHRCYLIVVTNDKDFWQGNKNDGIYSYFRNDNTLKGKIFKPTGKDEIKAINYHELNGEYKIQWNSLNDNFKYTMIEIKKDMQNVKI